MNLTTNIDTDDSRSLARVSLIGSLNTDTAPGFEARLEEALELGMDVTVLDMAELDYISSAGLRVIFKAAKQVKSAGRSLAAANRQPHIDKVFEILKALPDMAVFANDEEMDAYLDAMQDQVKGE